MFIGNGDDLAKMLLSQQANCIKCGQPIVFERGCNLAKECGIEENVVMCGQCYSVFTVHLVPGRMTLQRDVTGTYKDLTAKKTEEELEVRKQKEDRLDQARKATAAKRAAAADKELAEKLERFRKEEEAERAAKAKKWKEIGACGHCGGRIGGLFTKKCKSCGKPQ